MSQMLEKYLEEARTNRKQRMNSGNFQIIQNDKVYPALIVNAKYNEEKWEISNEFIVFTSPAGVRREVRFKVNGAGVHFYEEICETLGTNGNPRDLIGKAVYLHFEKNGEFQNVRVDGIMSNEELQEKIAEMEDMETKPRKKSKKGSVLKVQKKKSHKKANVREETGDLDESEELEEDLEDAEEYESDYNDDFDDFD